jgi:uncharacterized protein
MRWTDLAFLHWPVSDANSVRALLPAGLELDTWDGDAWLGIVPFRMKGVRHRWLPPIPTAMEFLELNVRTYVRAAGVPGVWFFSLDAASRLAVLGARAALNLPYYHADMSIRTRSSAVRYESRRTHRQAPAAIFRGSYTPAGAPFEASPGTIDHWLTERYCLYGQRGSGRLYRIAVRHGPWPLQRGDATIEENTMAEACGIGVAGVPPVVHYAARLDVLAWYPAGVGHQGGTEHGPYAAFPPASTP